MEGVALAAAGQDQQRLVRWMLHPAQGDTPVRTLLAIVI